jgi:hypothetical protein
VVRDLTVTNNIVFAQPGVKPLKYDVYAPKGARNLPVIVIIHGGGWNANDEDVMRGLARELTKGGRFVAVSMDYRWSGTSDGDKAGNTMANLIEDVFGGIAHVVEHAAQRWRPHGIGVTGDSAGDTRGVADDEQDRIARLRRTPGVFEFMPSYLPKGRPPTRCGRLSARSGRCTELRRVRYGATTY